MQKKSHNSHIKKAIKDINQNNSRLESTILYTHPHLHVYHQLILYVATHFVCICQHLNVQLLFSVLMIKSLKLKKKVFTLRWCHVPNSQKSF